MPQFLEYHQAHGRPYPIVTDKGTLNTDRYGLDTAIAVWKARMDDISVGNALGSPHPVWNYLLMEKRRIDIQPGFLIITGDYAGVGADTQPIYDASYGACQEPITTHPNFVTTLAGTASAPLNGAIFLDVETGLKTTDNARGVFSAFGPGIFAGVTDYLSPQVTVRKTWVSRVPVSGTGLGTIQSPGIGVGLSNWLLVGACFQQRGGSYVNSLEWRSGGRRGWNSTIYSG